jgi:hypothetical protein
VLALADKALTRAIASAPNYAQGHYVKAEVLGLSRRFDVALAAYVGRGRNLIAIGRAAETLRRSRRRYV